MPQAIYRYPGDENHVAAAAAAYSSGDIAQIGGLAGVFEGLSGAAIGDPANFRTKGVFEVACASATTFTEGAAVQWNDTTNLAVASGDFALGKAAKAKASGETTVWVTFNE